jgi:hypothetical protein
MLVARSSLGKRCSLWRSACRPLMLAAMGQPRVTQDASRNGQVTIEPADAARHTATFIGPIHGLGDTNQGWLGAAMHLHTQMPHVKFVLPNAPTMPVRSKRFGLGTASVWSGAHLVAFTAPSMLREHPPAGQPGAQTSAGVAQHGNAHALLVRHHLTGRPREPAVVAWTHPNPSPHPSPN